MKDASTFYYKSDGTGRDRYVLMDNGGLRPEYDKYNKHAEALFKSSLRSSQKSPINEFKDPIKAQADMTTYLNWPSWQETKLKRKNSAIQRAVMDRLYNKATSSHNITRIIGEKKSPGKTGIDTLDPKNVGGDYQASSMAQSLINGKVMRK